MKNQVAAEIKWVVHAMQKQQQLKVSPCAKTSLIAIPVDYRTDAALSRYTIQLWETSLAEIVAHVREGHCEHAKAFLQIFAFLKDPLGGLESVDDAAVDFFVYMMTVLTNSSHQHSGNSLPQASWHAAAAQAAQEALFLASPLLEHINYIHFSGHQQLPYVYVELDELPRSEFSIPEHVLRIVEEILTSDPLENEGAFPIAPISVSSYPALLPLHQQQQQDKQTTVIIDGNHRATATMLLRFIAEYPVILTQDDNSNSSNNNNDDDDDDNTSSPTFTPLLQRFCAAHTLGPKWQIDLADVLRTLHRDAHYTSFLSRHTSLIQRFLHVRTIPALVVREDHFHTVCQQRSAYYGGGRRGGGGGGGVTRPRLLLPIHQAVYNDVGLGFALPQAGQVHGRAVGFRALPLLREGEGREKGIKQS
ncbi:MAG: hypothetical protein Q9168_002464 [Polycauliona sp. 1 TL-2023]